ncbi:MAG: MoxR family ATPase [Planctomycetota bacterium]|nr:MoxR family ATPase [Planctomycetota bacterium]
MAKEKPTSDEMQLVEKFSNGYETLKSEMSKAVVGQQEVLEQLLIAVFSRGHCLLVGVPGLAKTLMVSTLARTMDLSFNRVQFTPDLMPSDITGTEVIQEDRSSGERVQKFIPGPIFANFVLADEINRTPPKTQAALLEAMQERQVTAGGKRYPLDKPFFVLATQNPIEQEGTYPLPEAQLDRFMFNVLVNYPSREEEFEIMKLTTAQAEPDVDKVLSRQQVIALQDIVRKVPMADTLINYVIDLVRKTRLTEGEAPDYVKKWLSWGAGPRAAQYMIIGAKARALLKGRLHVTVEDIQSLAKPVLRHRIITNFNAEAEGITPDDIVHKILDETEPMKGDLEEDGNVSRILRA